MRSLLIYCCMGMLLLGSCTALKYVPKEERLYTGASIKLSNDKKVKDQHKAVSECKDLLVPSPNTSILGSRPLLWLYYVARPTKKKGFRHWLRKQGQPPVYLSAVDPSQETKALDAKLYNIGFLDSYSRYEIDENEKKKTASITYFLLLRDPYTVKEVIYPTDTNTMLDKQLKQLSKKSLIKQGSRYDLEVLMNERERIDNRLKQRGFYYFNAEFIIFKMDTSLGSRELRLTLNMKRETPDRARRTYRIAEVNVYPDYHLGRDSISKANKEVIDSVNYYNETNYIRPQPVLRAVYLKNESLYDRRKHNLTLNRLNGLGVFKFVNVRITDKDSSGWLSANIFLTPMPKKSISIEVEGVSKSNNFLGPGLNFSLRNRNAFKGAELMVYSLRTSVETQFNGVYKGKFTYEVNPRVELYVPRFMAPFKLRTNSNYVPRTKFILDYSYLSRVGYLDINSFQFTFGYKWKQSLTIDHDLSLLNINYYNVYNISPSFNDLLTANPILRRRFETQFISSISYSFFYNEQVKRRKKNQFYFNGNAEVAGNTLAGYKKFIEGEPSTAANPSKIFGINFAQFVRADIDVRNYYNLGPKSMVAARFIAGWGLPYGNSSTMPYIKQFFSGGAYSVRGFQAFSLGPGTYSPPDSLKTLFFLQQGGEIKLEANVEYRFPIISVMRGALFADAGNVWLNNPQPSLPGAEFKKDQFLSQVAVGVGVGLRADLNFFVLRLDLGIPARKPWLPEGQRWVLDQFDLSSPQWRRENLVLNLAFGYPF